MPEEGYIKFNCFRVEEDFEFAYDLFFKLEEWRDRLYKLKLIGAYENGIGFGNISIRYPNTNQFIISGSATGNIVRLEKNHYALVTEYNFENNSLTCSGRINASSESLSHAAIYSMAPMVNGVIHIHDMALWSKLKFKLPTTAESITYGTPEMAKGIQSVITEHGLWEEGIIIMAGHEEGIISFGEDLDTGGKILLDKMKA